MSWDFCYGGSLAALWTRKIMIKEEMRKLKLLSGNWFTEIVARGNICGGKAREKWNSGAICRTFTVIGLTFFDGDPGEILEKWITQKRTDVFWFGDDAAFTCCIFNRDEDGWTIVLRKRGTGFVGWSLKEKGTNLKILHISLCGWSWKFSKKATFHKWN